MFKVQQSANQTQTHTTFIDLFLFKHFSNIALWSLPITRPYLAILEYLLKEYIDPITPKSHFVVIQLTINTNSWH
jgi:hypothetical protein